MSIIIEFQACRVWMDKSWILLILDIQCQLIDRSIKNHKSRIKNQPRDEKSSRRSLQVLIRFHFYSSFFLNSSPRVVANGQTTKRSNERYHIGWQRDIGDKQLSHLSLIDIVDRWGVRTIRQKTFEIFIDLRSSIHSCAFGLQLMRWYFVLN